MTLDYNYKIYLWIMFIKLSLKSHVFELAIGLIFTFHVDF